jgi:hypothetical protein
MIFLLVHSQMKCWSIWVPCPPSFLLTTIARNGCVHGFFIPTITDARLSVTLRHFVFSRFALDLTKFAVEKQDQGGDSEQTGC